MSASHACGLLGPRAHVAPAEPQRERRALEALARYMERLFPHAVADPPDGLWLEATGCERLHGGDAAMAGKAAAAIRERGFRARAALAPAPTAAWGLARYGEAAEAVVGAGELEDALAPLPLEALGLDAERGEGLAEVGVHRIGELAALARDEIADRFGAAVLDRLDAALGRVAESLPAATREPVLERRLGFEGAVTTTPEIERAARSLLEGLLADLARAHRGARRLELFLERERGVPLRRRRRYASASRRWGHLWPLLREAVRALRLEEPVTGLRLRAADAPLLAEKQPALPDADEAPPDAGAGIGELADELTARLGPERVLVARLHGTHVPEAAFRLQPAGETETAPGDSAGPGEAPRPSRLFARPVPARAEGAGEPPARLRFGKEAIAVEAGRGPERITPRWWRWGDPGSVPAPRDYYQARDARGRWWWIFRALGTGRWYVHGRWQ